MKIISTLIIHFFAILLSIPNPSFGQQNHINLSTYKEGFIYIGREKCDFRSLNLCKYELDELSYDQVLEIAERVFLFANSKYIYNNIDDALAHYLTTMNNSIRMIYDSWSFLRQGTTFPGYPSLNKALETEHDFRYPQDFYDSIDKFGYKYKIHGIGMTRGDFIHTTEYTKSRWSEINERYLPKNIPDKEKSFLITEASNKVALVNLLISDVVGHWDKVYHKCFSDMKDELCFFNKLTKISFLKLNKRYYKNKYLKHFLAPLKDAKIMIKSLL